ncbi:MAG: glycerol-3-phosphate 1-O-acyltransferase PlsY [Elusimicrobia bacterium]|nr:glycerol-3-phosphate 1-O-acyltransferase PlsY [Elusimicrobiota bacterium]
MSPGIAWGVRLGVILGAYLVGALPTGYLMGQWLKGLDIRQHGSGNPGAANVFRVLGKGPGAATLAVDIGKGVVAVLLAQTGDGSSPWFPILAGLAAITGHNWTPFLGLRGGKGVATSVGVCLTLLPIPCGVALAVFVLTFCLTRYVSVGSVVAATALPLAAWGFGSPWALRLFAVVAAGLVVGRHIPNLQRLRRGEEPRFQWRRPS